MSQNVEATNDSIAIGVVGPGSKLFINTTFKSFPRELLNEVKESTVILIISKNDTQSTYYFDVKIDEKLVISNQYLSSEELKKLKKISSIYYDILNLNLAEDEINKRQEELAQDLFDIWLASSWEEINKIFETKSQCTLVIASDISEALNLPWELLRPKDGEFLGIDPNFRIRRLPKRDELEKSRSELPSSPLRIIFMACAPIDQAPLDDVLEENAMIETMTLLDEVPFNYGNSGTFEELENLIEDFQPHIVHLTGHGSIKDVEGSFAFEDDNGRSDFRLSSEINRILSRNGTQCVFINICQEDEIPSVEVLNKICQGIISREVPFAIGWPTSLGEDLGAEFARKFYENLAQKNTIDDALFEARQHIWRILNKNGSLRRSWALPVLYSYTDQKSLFRTYTEETNKGSNQLRRIQQTAYRSIKGSSDDFFGRKREEQRLLPALKDGRLKIVIITGIEGSGKSTLAFGLSKRLQLTTRDFIRITIHCSMGDPLNLDQLLSEFSEALLEAAFNYSLKDDQLNARKFKAACKILIDAQLPRKNRIISFINTIMKEYPFLLIFDNFESNLDEFDLKIKDPDVAEIYKKLFSELSGESRAIIISKYLPSDQHIFPPTSRWETLTDFDKASCSKVLLNDTRKLPNNLLRDLYRTFGGNPEFLYNIRNYIKNTDVDQIKKELNSLIFLEMIDNSQSSKPCESRLEDNQILANSAYLNSNSKDNLDNISVSLVPSKTTRLAVVSNKPIEKLSSFIYDSHNRIIGYINDEDQRELLYAFKVQLNWLNNHIDPRVKMIGQKILSAFPPIDLAYQPKFPILEGTPKSLIETSISHEEINVEEISQEHETEIIKIPPEAGELGKIYLSCCKSMHASTLYSHLTLNSRKALCKVAVFRMPIELEGLIAVTNEPQDTVKGFFNEWQDRALAYSETKGKRELYTIYGLLRNWLLAQLTPEERKAAHKAAGDFLSRQKGKKDLGLLRTDYLHEAVMQYIQADNKKLSSEMTKKLSRYLSQLGFDDEKFQSEKFQLHEEVYQIYKNPTDAYQIGDMYFKQRNIKKAREWFEKSLGSSAEIKPRERADALHGLAKCDYQQGKYMSAMERIKEALENAKNSHDNWSQAQVLHYLGVIANGQGKYDDALNWLNEAIKMRPKNDDSGRASTLHLMGEVYQNQQKYEDARKNFEAALNIRLELRNYSGVTRTTRSLGRLDLEEEKYSDARNRISKLLTIKQEHGDAAGESAALYELAMLDKSLGHYRAAKDKFQKSIEINQQLGKISDEAASLVRLATIDLDEGDLEDARIKLNKVLKINNLSDNKAGEATSWQRLGELDLEEGKLSNAKEKFNNAREKFEKSLIMSNRNGNKEDEATSWKWLAQVDLEESKYSDAQAELNNVLSIYKEIGKIGAEATVWNRLATIDLIMGNFDGARAKFKEFQEIKRQINEVAGYVKTSSMENSYVEITQLRDDLEKAQEYNDKGSQARLLINIAKFEIKMWNYDEAQENVIKSLEINRQMEFKAGEASSWYYLAIIDMGQKEYDAAKEKFQILLKLNKEIDNKDDEAATWRWLAKVDLEKEKYMSAREKIKKSLKINIEINKLEYVASAFVDLGQLAWKVDRPSDALKLKAIGYHVGLLSNHKNVERFSHDLKSKASRLNFTNEQLNALLLSAKEAYEHDKGQSLIEEAFSEQLN